MNKKVYLSNLEWTKTHDNMGGVKAEIVFKDNMTYEEYEKLHDKTYYVLTNTDLEEKWNNLKKCIEDQLSLMKSKQERIRLLDFVLDKMNALEKGDIK